MQILGPVLANSIDLGSGVVAGFVVFEDCTWLTIRRVCPLRVVPCSVCMNVYFPEPSRDPIFTRPKNSKSWQIVKNCQLKGDVGCV
jgi:hypothetical protein